MQITINDDVTFLISDALGNITEGGELGLYHDDARFLCRFELTLDTQQPIALSARATTYRTALYFLTNPPLLGVPRGQLSIIRRREAGLGMREELEVTNHHDQEAVFALEMQLDADFAHIFEVKHSVEVKKEHIRREGTFTRTVGTDGRSLRFDYQRGPAMRRLSVAFSEPPLALDDVLTYHLRLAPRATWTLAITFDTQAEAQAEGGAPEPVNAPLDTAPTHRVPASLARRFWLPRRDSATRDRQERHREILLDAPTLTSDSYVLERAYQQSINDFAALRIKGEDVSGGTFTIAAGIPWFMALFGRDALIAAYQALPFFPDAARGVLRALARLQGTQVDPARGEEPGKIIHEYRYGQVTGSQQLLDFPYYGSVDSTPLFLMLLAAVYRVTGDLDLAYELREPALRALNWMSRYGDRDGDGYLEYVQEGGRGLVNQGWKDSHDAIRFQDGRIARAPIALCEVQGYAYAARIGMIEVFEALGDHAHALRMRGEAATLKVRFNREFWLRDRDYYALALDAEKRPVDAITSNPGHLLWTGIASDEQARCVADRLLTRELFSGWGVRTMATGEAGYNPLSYHCGSVWPHDNSLIVAGLARYGFADEAAKVAGGLLAALSYAPDFRLPELFAGYGLHDAPFPVEYPTANRPQAWASGSVLLLLASMAGLDPSVPASHGVRGVSFLAPQVERLALDRVWADRRRTQIEVLRKGKGVQSRRASAPLMARLGLTR